MLRSRAMESRSRSVSEVMEISSFRLSNARPCRRALVELSPRPARQSSCRGPEDRPAGEAHAHSHTAFAHRLKQACDRRALVACRNEHFAQMQDHAHPQVPVVGRHRTSAPSAGRTRERLSRRELGRPQDCRGASMFNADAGRSPNQPHACGANAPRTAGAAKSQRLQSGRTDACSASETKRP